MSIRILTGDCRDALKTLPDASVHCVVTSPPYFGLRDYGVAGQIGLEESPDAYVARLVEAFGEVRRVLREDGTLWLNLGDSYAGGGGHFPNAPSSKTSKSGLYGKALREGGVKPQGDIKGKDLIGIPWTVAFALRADGWYLRQDIIWHKPNPMPESVTDRCTKAHEHVFLLTKSPRYFFDADAIAEGLQTDPKERYEERARITGRGQQGAAGARGNDRDRSGGFPPRQGEAMGLRNKRSVWTIPTQPYAEAHFATMAPRVAELCILAGCPAGGIVLDPFGGAGTTGMVADRLGRDAILIELNPAYAALARQRLVADAGMFAQVSA